MRTFFASLLAAAVFTSCYVPRYAYSPSAQNVPLLTAKNDAQAGIMYSTNGGSSGSRVAITHKRSNGLDAQAAYAISNHIAVQGSYFLRNEQNATTKVDIKYKRNLVEGGVGYYTSIGKNSWFQAFGGYGTGQSSLKDNGIDTNNIYTKFHQFDVSKFYIQPAFILTDKNKQIMLGLSSRVNFVNFKNIQTDYSAEELTEYNLALLNSKTAIFLEFYLTNSFEFDKIPGIRFQYQFGISGLQSNNFLDARTSSFSVGAFADITKLLHKNSK